MKETSVEEAAVRLRKTQRSIRGYIAEKRLRAKKVGKKWFVDEKSLEKLAKSIGNLPEITSGISVKFPEKTTGNSDPSKAKSKNPKNLACFRLANEAFTMALWRQTQGPLREEFSAIQMNVLKALGAGYYSYGKAKARYYSEARAQLGAALGLVYADEKMFSQWASKVRQDKAPFCLQALSVYCA